MRFILTGLLPFYCILSRCVGVWGAGASNGNGNSGTEYELKIDTRSGTENCNYYKCNLDGLESHLFYTKSGHVVSKVMDGSTELWSKEENVLCLGAVFTYKNNEKKLGLLVLMGTSFLKKPLEIRRFQFNNNNWEVIEIGDYFDKLKTLVDNNQNSNYKDLDLSKEDELAKFSEVAKSKFYHEFSFYFPQEDYKLNKVTEGSNLVWERDSSKKQYGLYCVFAKNESDDKFVLVVIRTGSEYEDKYFVLENNEWKCVNYYKFKFKLGTSVAKKKLDFLNKGDQKNNKQKNQLEGEEQESKKQPGSNENKSQSGGEEDQDWGNWWE